MGGISYVGYLDLNDFMNVAYSSSAAKLFLHSFQLSRQKFGYKIRLREGVFPNIVNLSFWVVSYRVGLKSGH